MLTVRNVFDDLLLLLYIENADNAPVYIRNQVLGDIQAAVQMMASCGEDYYGRTTITQSLTSGTARYNLSGVQTVLEPVRIVSLFKILRKLTTRAELISFPQLFMESLDPLMPAGVPAAYWIESLNSAYANQSESVELWLNVAPKPDAGSYIVTMDIIPTAPTFTLADLCNSSKYIPVPHQYTESIFLPLARWQVTTHTWFTATEKIPQLRADYERALRLLGISDPRRPKPDGLNNDAAALPAPAPQEKEAA